MGDFEKHSGDERRAGPSGRKIDRFFTVHKNGQIYISAEVYEEYFYGEGCAIPMIDTSDKRLGLKPAEETNPECAPIKRNRVACKSALRTLDFDFPEKSERYRVQEDDEHDFPYIDLTPDSKRDSPAGQVNDEEETFTDDSTEMPTHFVKTSNGNLHAPAEDSTMDDPEPACGANTPKNGWSAKTREQVPVDFYDHCSNCEDDIEEMFNRG